MPHTHHKVHQHGDHHDIPDEHRIDRTGGWLPADHRTHKEWMAKTVEHVDNNPKPLIPVLQEFKDLIESNSVIYKHVSAMFEEIPHKKAYRNDPTGNQQIRDYQHMLEILNHLLTTAPTWTDTAAHVGMVGVPINAVFDWPMGTPSGHAFFLDATVNKMLKKVLNVWGEYLKTEDSASCLNDENGWFAEVGINDLQAVANGPHGTNLKFHEMYKCDPSAKYHGFKSWDDFFTRQFQESWRPVAAPDNDDIIVNACESKTYRTEHDVKLRDRFWIKGQPYSVLDMLGHDALAEQFAGGTIYQAFLSALSYHRWHMPISGTIKKAFVVDGTYFSEPLWEGIGDPHTKGKIDQKGICDAQGYITALAARAVIFIEADNPKIGLMAFIGVGMDEVSTCEITVKEGQHYKKGDQAGMFHFGGSSHCLLFRPGVNVGGFPESGKPNNVPIRSELAVVK